MPKSKIQTVISSENRQTANKIAAIVWTGVFQVIDNQDFTGEEASSVAAACAKAANRALTKLLSTPETTDEAQPVGSTLADQSHGCPVS